MKIKAKIPLVLSKTKYKIELKYNTFVKATFDQYLAASILKYTKSLSGREKYIKEITGKGSLNSHLNKLCDNILEKGDNIIDDILENNVFPMTIIDEKNYYLYYDDLDISVFKGKLYKGTPEENDIKAMLLPDDDNIELQSFNFTKENENKDQNIFWCEITDEDIKVEIQNEYHHIQLPKFRNALNVKEANIDEYKGRIDNKTDTGNWNLFTQDQLTKMLQSLNKYYDLDNNLCIIHDDYIDNIKVSSQFGHYFYTMDKIPFNKNNANICNTIIEKFVNNEFNNNLKSSTILAIARNANAFQAQKIINYILVRRNFKELSQLGLEILTKGLYINWTDEALQNFKMNAKPHQLSFLYEANNVLDYSIDQLLNIDRNILTANDKVRVEEYMKSKANIITQLNLLIGEMTNSGLREKMKSLKTKDNVFKAMKEAFNKRVGHNKIDYNSMSLEQLEKEFRDIKNIYDGPYQKIKERCNINKD